MPAAIPDGAGLARLDPRIDRLQRLDEVGRTVELDASIAGAFAAVDNDTRAAGERKTSGILEVSTPFAERRGTFF